VRAGQSPPLTLTKKKEFLVNAREKRPIESTEGGGREDTRREGLKRIAERESVLNTLDRKSIVGDHFFLRVGGGGGGRKEVVFFYQFLRAEGVPLAGGKRNLEEMDQELAREKAEAHHQKEANFIRFCKALLDSGSRRCWTLMKRGEKGQGRYLSRRLASDGEKSGRGIGGKENYHWSHERKGKNVVWAKGRKV